jgi:hypothetical protein
VEVTDIAIVGHSRELGLDRVRRMSRLRSRVPLDLPVHAPDCQDNQNRYRKRVPWIGDAEGSLGEGPEESDAAPRSR